MHWVSLNLTAAPSGNISKSWKISSNLIINSVGVSSCLKRKLANEFKSIVEAVDPANTNPSWSV
jgi:hypothetical protein